MSNEPKLKTPELVLSKWESAEKPKAIIPGVNYLYYDDYVYERDKSGRIIKNKSHTKKYKNFCDKVKDENAECKYNDDVNNKEKLINNLGCLYGRINKKVLEGDTDVTHQDQIRYHVAYTKKCINLLHKPPLKKTPTDFMNLLREKLLNNGDSPYYRNKMFFDQTVDNTAEVYQKTIRTSADEINARHRFLRETHKNRKNYREYMNNLYLKAILASANKIANDIKVKNSSSDYYDIFGKDGKILKTKTEISDKIKTILPLFLKTAQGITTFDERLYNKNSYQKYITLQGAITERITKETLREINDNLTHLIEEFPQIKELEAKKTAATTAAAAEESRKAAAAAAASEPKTKEQELRALQKKLRNIVRLEGINQSKLDKQQKEKLASKQNVEKSIQKLKSSQGGTRKLRR